MHVWCGVVCSLCVSSWVLSVVWWLEETSHANPMPTFGFNLHQAGRLK